VVAAQLTYYVASSSIQPLFRIPVYILILAFSIILQALQVMHMSLSSAGSQVGVFNVPSIPPHRGNDAIELVTS
jgi:hypothetical protein